MVDKTTEYGTTVRNGTTDDLCTDLTWHSDAKTLVRERTAFVQNAVSDAGADGAVVPLYGDRNSAVAATLAVMALGTENVFGLVLPAEEDDRTDVANARAVADDLGIEYRVTDVQPLVDQFVTTVATDSRETKADPFAAPSTTVVANDADRSGVSDALENVTARFRTMVAYFEANTTDRLVVGSSDRTARLLGAVTKHGESGVDLLPLGDCYATEVAALGDALGVPARVFDAATDSPPVPELAAADLPAETVDELLYELVECGRSASEVAAAVDVDEALVAACASRCETTAHKRVEPPEPDDLAAKLGVEKW